MAVAVAPVASELVGLLADELRLHDQLLDLARRERDTVLGSDPSALETLVVDKEALIAQVGRAEARRQQWIADWAASAGVDPAGLTLSAVATVLPADEASELEASRGRLLARVRELAELNARNHHLVSSALNVVSRRLDAFNRVTTALGYRASGATVTRAASAQLDLRA